MANQLRILRNRLPYFALTVLSSPALAQDAEFDQLVRPESMVSIGVGSVSADNQRFGSYRGLSQKGEHLIGEFSFVRRDDETATWLRAEGRNLGLSTREFRIEHERQGDWAYSLDYSQMSRVAPVGVHTTISGIGSAYLSIPVTGNTTTGAGIARTSAGETEIKTEREKTVIGLMKELIPGLDLNVKFQNEEKQGTRIFGRGTVNGANIAQEFLAEPINSTTRQLDITLGYVKDTFQLNGGYYGSFYNNHNPALFVAGGNNQFTTATPPFTVMSLPPDNFAHQFHLTGGYDFSKTTRATFKYAYTRNIQDDTFIPLPTGGANISGRDSLGGRVDTTLMQLGLTTKPVKDLSVLANWRHENRADKTATAKYITASTSTDGYNEPRSLKIDSGKLEASYQLPEGLRATGGVDYERKERSMAGIRVVGYRIKTEELSYRAELRRSLFDSVSGAISVIQSDRRGSDYWTNAGTNLVQPIYIADRDRSKLKWSADWSPHEAVSLQAVYEDSRDRYGAGRGSPDVGVRAGGSRMLSLDGSYTISDKWQLTGFVSRLTTTIDQVTGSSAANQWTAAMKELGRTYGMGVRGKLTGTMDVGADLLWSRDASVYDLSGGGASSLPTIHNAASTYKLFAKYAYDKQTTFKVEYINDHRKTDDWTWNGTTTPYVFTDGSWLYQNPNEKVRFLGVSAQYRFQ